MHVSSDPMNTALVNGAAASCAICAREWAATADNPRQASATCPSHRGSNPNAISDHWGCSQPVRVLQSSPCAEQAPLVVTTLHRLRGFFVDVWSRDQHQPRKCQACYDADPAPSTGYASMHRWRRWVRPAAGSSKKGYFQKKTRTKKIEKVAARVTGFQLMVDEARRWLQVARHHADQGEAGVVAAMMSLLMGLRTTEITERTAREVDDAGKLLWITDSKTKAGRRRVEVPEMLQPYLLRLKSDRQPTALLFGQHWRDWPRKWVQRICVEAGVPRVTAHGMRGLHATLALQAGDRFTLSLKRWVTSPRASRSAATRSLVPQTSCQHAGPCPP